MARAESAEAYRDTGLHECPRCARASAFTTPEAGAVVCTSCGHLELQPAVTRERDATAAAAARA